MKDLYCQCIPEFFQRPAALCVVFWIWNGYREEFPVTKDLWRLGCDDAERDWLAEQLQHFAVDQVELWHLRRLLPLLRGQDKGGLVSDKCIDFRHGPESIGRNMDSTIGANAQIQIFYRFSLQNVRD